MALTQVPSPMLAPGTAGNGPAFSAYPSTTQSLSNNTVTKVMFNVENFDTANCYDTTNYRFTPNIAGYYQFISTVNFGVASSAGRNQNVNFYKNGSFYGTGSLGGSSTTDWIAPCATSIIYMNGSTDYVEIYAYQNTGSTQTIQTSYSIFQAALVRAA